MLLLIVLALIKFNIHMAYDFMYDKLRLIRTLLACRRDADLSLVVVTAARVIDETTFEDTSRSSRRHGACCIDNHRGIFVERHIAVSLTR